MTAINVFRKIAPEFSDIEDAEVLSFLDLASTIADNIPLRIQDLAFSYLAAHFIDLARKRMGSGGQVKSITEGSLNIEYTGSNIAKGEYEMSNYGRMYLDIIKTVCPTIYIT